jgi:hypothetical protein
LLKSLRAAESQFVICVCEKMMPHKQKISYSGIIWAAVFLCFL